MNFSIVEGSEETVLSEGFGNVSTVVNSETNLCASAVCVNAKRNLL